MIEQKNTVFWFKLNGLLREFIVRGGCKAFSTHYTVNEYPKSGGSWLSQMLAEALEMPFPRNRLPMFSSSIMQGHYLRPWNMQNPIVLWRDGRDIIVSQYYHSLFVNDRGNSKLVDLVRNRFSVDDYNDIRNNLPKFIEFTFTKKVAPRFSWTEFVDEWAGRNVAQYKYEDLRIDTACELVRIVRELSGLELDTNRANDIAIKYSFEKQSGRKPGDESITSFARKGIVGDWMNHFTVESKEMFDFYAGDALIALGYENDHAWVNDEAVN